MDWRLCLGYMDTSKLSLAWGVFTHPDQVVRDAERVLLQFK